MTPPIDPPCEVILYRSIWYPTRIDPDDDSKVMPDAFARRRPRPKEDGTVDPMDEASAAARVGDYAAALKAAHLSAKTSPDQAGTLTTPAGVQSFREK